MTDTRRLIIGALVTPAMLALIVGLALLATVVTPADDASAAVGGPSVHRMDRDELLPATPARCVGHTVKAEDDPCWDWTQGGNGARGIVTRYGRFLVVDACRFRRLWRADRIDYPRSERMIGDAWAVAHGCQHTTGR